MGKRDSRYTLEGMIEMDEGYFTVESSEIEKSQGSQDRGAAGKTNVGLFNKLCQMGKFIESV